MTISTEAGALSYDGDGSTTAFSITWKYFAKSDVVATLRSSTGIETVQTLTTNYTLTDAGVAAGGTLTMITAPANNETLVITLEPTNTQSTSLPVGGAFPSLAVEDALDLSAQRDSKLEDFQDRTLRVPKTDTQSGSNLEIPIDSDRASKFLSFDANGKPIAAAGTSANLGPVSTFIDTLLDDTTAAIARTTLDAVGLSGNETIAGNKTFSGTLTINDIITLAKSLYEKKGADIASANDTALLADGNYNDVTGTTTTNGMTDGVLNELRWLQYDGAVPLKHNTAASSGFSSLFLPGAADYTTAAGDLFAYRYDGALWRVAGYILSSGKALVDTLLATEQASTSGTSIDFTGIPAGVKKITIMFSAVSTNGTNNLYVQLGDSGGIESSGYVGGIGSDGAANRAANSGGFNVSHVMTAATAHDGMVILSLENPTAFRWTELGILNRDDNGSTVFSAGNKTLSAELTQIRITTSGSTDTFDAGSINIQYE